MQPVHVFRPCNRWVFKNNLLTGLTLPAWLRILWQHGVRIDWQLYWQRALFLTAMSCLQSVLGLTDSLIYGRRIRTQALHPEPVFILGHPRTGTTLVHNMLAQDPRFGTPQVFHCGFPSAFLSLQRWSWLFAPVLDERRPMDNMRMDFSLPCEDELAVNVLSAGCSCYMPITFMRDHRRFRKFYTFKPLPERCRLDKEDAHGMSAAQQQQQLEEVATPAEFASWQDNFLWFLRKVTLQAGGKPLVVKSPVHTARVGLLLELFPNARFIYCHRDPLEIFKSAAHMAQSYYTQCYLQQPSNVEVTDFILEQFELLHETYMLDRKLIPPGHLVEVPFAELDADPVAAMHRIYTELGWQEDWAGMQPVFQDYASTSLAGFKKNDHRRLPVEMQRRIVRRWRAAFDTFGYSTELQS